MTAEEALKTIEHALDRGYLNQVEEIVFCGVWEGRSYLQIAQRSGYDYGYIKDTGYKLWRSLSAAYGEKVTKHNVKGIVHRDTERPLRQSQSRPRQVVNFLPLPKQNWECANTSWGDATDVSIFYDRAQELTKLEQWIVTDRCRIITLLGTGGIGKTALSVKIAHLLKADFDFVVWQSLRDAPPLAELLPNLIKFLAPELQADIPETISGQLSRLIECLRKSRCFIVLDYVDAVLTQRGRYRPGYEAYGELLHRVSEIPHRSCVLLTSREKPAEVIAFEGEKLAVRSLPLSGLNSVAGEQVLAAKGLQATLSETQAIMTCCKGNPLALKIAATLILDSFEGNIADFLHHTEQTHSRITDNERLNQSLIDRIANRSFENVRAVGF